MPAREDAVFDGIAAAVWRCAPSRIAEAAITERADYQGNPCIARTLSQGMFQIAQQMIITLRGDRP